MTREQYERWKDFARRMVNVAVSARKRSPSRADVLATIEFFFDCRMEPGEEWRRVRNWDNTDRDDKGQYRMCVSDHMSEIAEYHVPGYWNLPDGERGDDIVDRWMGPAHMCVRAGLDVIVAPSAGVLGFTAGDIRKMYPDGVPSWFSDWVLREMKHRNGKPVRFERLKDNVGLWL